MMNMEHTLFEKIIAREIPAEIIYEDDICIAILDKFPVNEGQTLIIPKKAVDYAFDLDTETYQHLFAVAKKIALVLDKTFNTIRTCLLIEGLEIPHTHIKLYPLTEPHLEISGGSEMDDKKLAITAAKIKNALT